MIAPPWLWTMRWEMARPRPVPLPLVVKNGSNTRSRNSVVMPFRIDYVDSQPGVGERCADPELASFGHGVQRILNDIDEHLLELVGVQGEFDARGEKFCFHDHPPGRDVLFEESEGIGEKYIDIGALTAGDLWS